MIKLDGLRFSYGESPIIDNLSLSVGAGELTAISGPNGSGKTTLLYLITGLQRADSGSVVIDGRPLRDYTRREMARKISLMPQYLPYTPWLTVAELVELGRYSHSGKGFLQNPLPTGLHDMADSEIVALAMEHAGVGNLAGRLSGELSGGELRRAHLARVLAQDADVILLDEPTGDLDLYHQGELMSLLKKLAADGKTVIVVTHDLNFAARLGVRLVLMKDGRIIGDGSPDEIIDDSILAQAYIGGFEVLKTDSHHPVVLPRPKE